MVKKTVTFNDFSGNPITKDFYFNLNKMEFRKLNNSIPGGLQNLIEEIQRGKDTEQLIDLLSMLILQSYGEKGPNGEFVKYDTHGQRLSNYFEVSDAWDVMFLNLINNESELTDFLTGIVPKDVGDSAKQALANGELTAIT